MGVADAEAAGLADAAMVEDVDGAKGAGRGRGKGGAVGVAIARARVASSLEIMTSFSPQPHSLTVPQSNLIPY